MKRTARTIAFACVLLAVFVASMMTTSVNAAASPSSSLGWGGFIISTSQAESVLTTLDNRGYTAIRYEANAPFLSSSSRHRISYTVLDYIISRASSLGITVIIDPIHNYPESTAYTLQSHFSDWEAELLEVGSRYNSKSNVILECVNEYKLSDASTKFQAIVTYLRNHDVTLPLHFNYMWGSVGTMTPPKDPLGKISIGHHIYGDHNTDASYMRSGETWVQYCTRIGLEAREKKMFTSTETCWFGYALSHGTKVLCTEVGGSNREVMTPYNVAFVIRTLEYAKMYGVGITCFRVGDPSNLATYERKAQEYFHRSLYTP